MEIAKAGGIRVTFKNADKIEKLNSQDIPWHFTPKTDDQKLFDLLTKLGFKKTEDNEKIIFKNDDDEIFVYPQTGLQRHHYMAKKKHLDMNGRINKCDFD